MRAVIQRVREASVQIDGIIHGQIKTGLVVLLGIEESDTQEDVHWLASKIARMRIFSDAEGLMNCSLQEAGGQLLLISQFTLFASTKKGNRPSFIRAARPEQAVPLYELMISKLVTETSQPIQTGVFGADMQVALVNDGPVTIWMDTRQKE